MKRAFFIHFLTGTFCLSAFGQEMPFIGGDDGNPVFFAFEAQEIAASRGPQTQKVALNEQKLNVSVPLHKGETASWSAVLKGQRLALDEKLVIADRNFEIPREFGSAEAGIGWRDRWSDQQKVGVVGTLGATGRSLLSNRNAVEVSINGFVENKKDNGDAWIYFANYSNNRTLLNNIPILGFAYVMKRDTSVYVMGVPFLFFFNHSGRWLSNATLSPFFAGGEVTYIIGWPQIFAGAGWMPRSYQNLVTDDAEDRLFYEKKEAALGVRLPFGKQRSASLAYVHQFDRRFYLGESFAKIHSDVLSLQSAGGLQFKMKYAF